MTAVVIKRGDDSPIHVPHERIDSGWSVRAVLREYPTGPEVEQWNTGDGSAVIEGGNVVLLTDRLRGEWTVGDLTVHLTDPAGARTVLDPVRVRLR